MAKVTCAISGLTFSVSHLPIVLRSEDGYFHPIFALPYKKLYGLYSKHCKGELTPTDSYLLLLAFLHSTDKVRWDAPASRNPKDHTTIGLVDANLYSLIKAVEISNSIYHPAFKQPSFVVNKENSSLTQLSYWIETWEDNIKDFKAGYISSRLQEDIQKIENKLTYHIKSGVSPERYASVVADWAATIAEFPPQKEEAWKKIIRSCFNSIRMFNTPITEIKEVKDFCALNIEVGSIHFHTLMEVLNEGASRHVDFLGISYPEDLGFSIVPSEATKGDVELKAILAQATDTPPNRLDYPSDFEFTKAKMKYSLALISAQKQKDASND